MTGVTLLGVPENLLTIGVIALLGLCLLAVVMQLINARHETEREPLTLEEEVEVAVELHAIRRRLEVAKARAEIHRSGVSLRQKIMEELHEQRS